MLLIEKYEGVPLWLSRFKNLTVRTVRKKEEAETGVMRSQAGLLTNRVAGSTEQRELRLPAIGARAFL